MIRGAFFVPKIERKVNLNEEDHQRKRQAPACRIFKSPDRHRLDTDDGFCFYTIGGTDRILLLWRLLCQRGRKLLLFRKFIQFSGI